MFISFKRIIKLGWIGFRRNSGLSFATIFIMVITVSLITSLFLLQKASQFLILDLRERVGISVYFNEESPEAEILEIKKEVSQLPEVKNVEYVSKEEALQKFTQRHRKNKVIMESLKELGSNPLLASLTIKAREAVYYASISSFLDGAPFKNLIASVDYYQKKPVIERLFSITSTINKIGIILSIILAMIAILVAFNTVKLAIYNSKEEIEIMRLVGASNWFIRGPFLVQGIIAGISAVLITLSIFTVAIFLLSPKVETFVHGLNFSEYFFGNIFIIFLIQLAVGVGLGVFSSWIAVRRYLRV